MKKTVMVSAVAMGLSLAFSANAQAAQPSVTKGYAEGVYAEYSAASDRDMRFEVKTLASGNLKELEGRSFGEIVGMPRYHIEASEDRFKLRNGRFNEDLGQFDRSDLDGGVEGFDEVGLPVAMGSYRRLAVTASVGGRARVHEALEMCWQEQAHCVVFDPSIVFLDSIVQNRRQAAAAGYAPTVRYELRPQPVRPLDGRATATLAACALASDPRYISKWLTWAPWTQKYKNVYGMTLVTKNLGGQQSGIRCDASCNPAPFGYSNSSSASGTLGYGTDCGNKYTYGKSGRTGRWVAETKCAHRFSGSARADVTVKGTGASVNLAWDTNGGIDSNGGYFTDTCGYF
ncbi:hypothetical protein [Luteimonas aquatica]|uniref:hypothetical protein n=1 Tax=Luteimonas aquatica TaxID=450364 RepID=UPI001F55BE6E|nr:hypothetical protein [Luteimonas aquatica]